MAAAEMFLHFAIMIDECCIAIVRERFHCEHTREQCVDDLKKTRRELMLFLRHHATYSSDATWSNGLSILSSALLSLGRIRSVRIEEEREYLSACIVHVSRKLSVLLA